MYEHSILEITSLDFHQKSYKTTHCKIFEALIALYFMGYRYLYLYNKSLHFLLINYFVFNINLITLKTVINEHIRR